jgi:hypothetical protein
MTDAAATGDVRNDVPPMSWPTYCRRALDAAGELPTESAIPRLVALIHVGLRGDPESTGR